jgi:hypothetical protein
MMKIDVDEQNFRTSHPTPSAVDMWDSLGFQAGFCLRVFPAPQTEFTVVMKTVSPCNYTKPQAISGYNFIFIQPLVL